MPLSYAGTLIENIRLEFLEGKVQSATASSGEAVLRQVLAADEIVLSSAGMMWSRIATPRVTCR